MDTGGEVKKLDWVFWELSADLQVFTCSHSVKRPSILATWVEH